MILMIVYTKALRNILGYSGAGPQICWKPGCLCSLEQSSFHLDFLLDTQLRRATRYRPELQGLIAVLPMRCFPSSNTSPINSNHASNVNRLIALIQQFHRALSAMLQFLRASGRFHILSTAQSYRTFVMQESVVPWKDIKEDWLTFDSTVIERYGKQEGVKRGYNPKKKGRGSHSPLMESSW